MTEHQLFEISQSVIIKNKDGNILILRHSTSGKWLLPGGRINAREDWHTALNREIQEETGMDFKINGILDVDSFSDGDKFSYVVVFVGETDDTNVVLSTEHDEYMWISNQSDSEKYDFWHPDIAKRIKMFFTQTPHKRF